MTVRWKPLVFLSGVFLIVGLIGVVAIILTLVPRSTQDILRRARTCPRGRAIRRCRDLFQASPPDRRQGRGDSRGIRRLLSRLGQARSRREAAFASQ